MPHLPIYFDFAFRLTGPSFGARVRIRGRATCVEEFGAAWCYGVNPGALAESGEDVRGACDGFRRRMAEVFCDLAEMEGDFAAFREAARRFVDATDRVSVAEWERARQALREGAAPDAGLRRETEDLVCGVEVGELPRSRPADSSRADEPGADVLPWEWLDMGAESPRVLAAWQPVDKVRSLPRR